MEKSLKSLFSYTYVQLLLIVTSFFSLAFAYGAEILFHVKPCALCLYERYVYVMIFLAGVSHFHIKNKNRAHLWIQLAIILIGLALALYHLGVENHWWQGTAACRGNEGLPTPKTLQELKSQMAMAKIPQCDQVNWVIFSVSATIWNFLIFLGLTTLVSITTWLTRKK